MRKDKKKFVRRALVFIIILALAIVFINTLYDKLITKRTIRYRLEDLFQEHLSTLPDSTIDYIFLGDSHTVSGVNPRFIENSYVLGAGGASYVEHYLQVRKIIEIDKVNIKNIVLTRELDDFMIFSDPIWDIWYFKDYFSYRELSRLQNKSWVKIFFKSNFPWMGLGRNFFHLAAPQKILYKGWQYSEGNFSTWDKEEAGAAAVYDRFTDNRFTNNQRFNPLSIEGYQEILKLAKKHNINIIFITYPVAAEYAQQIKVQKVVVEEYWKKVDDITHAITTNYETLDYFSFFFEDSDFLRNPEHLNYQGAEVLSRQIAIDLDNLKE